MVSEHVQVPLLTVSPHCRRAVFVRRSYSYLDVSHSTLPQSTFVCPSVVDASPCSPTVLSCRWRSVNVDAGVSVQRAAAMSSAGSVSWCCSCVDVSCSSLSRSTSVCPSVVDRRSSVTSVCTPDDSCTLLVEYVSPLLPEHTDLSIMSTLVDTKKVNVDQSSCRGCGPTCSRRTFASATSPL